MFPFFSGAVIAVGFFFFTLKGLGPFGPFFLLRRDSVVTDEATNVYQAL